MTTEPTPANEITATPPTPIVSAPTITPVSEPAAPAIPSPPSRWPLRFDVVIFALLLVLSFFVASFTATNPDLWMHRAVGKLLAEGKFSFGVDPFSWATEASADRPAVYWTHHSWLFSLLVYHLINLVGGSGLVIGKAVLFTATIVLLSRIGWNAANRWFLLFCLALAVLATTHRLLLQPIVVSFLFLAITMFILYRVGIFANHNPSPTGTGENADRRWLWALPPLFALWANVDHWFILGPIILALCWAGSGLASWYPNGSPVPGKTIGLVLGVGLLACLANPHHVRVFELPPELAYVVLSLTDPIGLPLPDALVAGGRTLRTLQKADYGNWTVSTLSSEYALRLGMNIAGWSVYFLLVMGLAAFTLMALVKPQAGAPTLQVNRFLLWLVFGVLALLLYRLIPFFALIAAPLTAMTLGEFLVWQQDTNGVTQEKRDRGLQLARLTSVPFLLLLLFFAWPGWLTGGFESPQSPRRVAWDMQANASMVQAGETLNDLKNRGECQNVFNTNMDWVGYLAWYAPDVKFGMDTRFSLYPREVESFLKTRKSLLDFEQKAGDWMPVFEERKIDQVILDSPLAAKAGTPSPVFKWWLDDENWRQRYGDGRVVVFSWSGPNKSWGSDTARHDWDRQAFGSVPMEKRPPVQGIDAPQPFSPVALYLAGLGPTPVGVAQCQLYNEYFAFPVKSASRSRNAVSLYLTSLAGLPSMTGGLECLPSLKIVFPEPPVADKAPANKRSDPQLWAMPQFEIALDIGPPALPILMVRAARKAVAESPADGATFRTLLIANQILREKQEDYWIGYQRSFRFSHPSALRDRLRQTQLVANAFEVVQLQHDNFDQQRILAILYKQTNLIDSALEHMLLAEQAMAKRLAEAKDPPKDADRILKNFRDEMVTPLEKAVRERLAKLKEKSDLKPLEQAAFAYAGTYEDMDGNQRVRVPMGLGKKALEILMTIDAKTLKPEEEPAFLRIWFELLFNMGRIDILSKDLKRPDIRKALPEGFLAECQVYSAGTLGNYQEMDEALVLIEKAIRSDMAPIPAILAQKRLETFPGRFIAPTFGWPDMLASAAAEHRHFKSIEQYYKLLNLSGNLHNGLYNAMTLRGIAALEAGDTAKAREIFAATLKEAGTEHPFSDRPIAQRYLELLNENK